MRGWILLSYLGNFLIIVAWILSNLGQLIVEFYCKKSGGHELEDLVSTMKSCKKCGQIWDSGQNIDPRKPNLDGTITNEQHDRQED